MSDEAETEPDQGILMIHSTRRATFGPELQSTTMATIFLRGKILIEARMHGNIVVLETRIGDTTLTFHAQSLAALQQFSDLIASTVEALQTDELVTDAPPTNSELTAAAAYSSADLPF